MDLNTRAFDFEYTPTEVVFGRGCATDLVESLDERGLARALVVCGTNVGANSGVMEPVTAGLGDRLTSVFDETTPKKEIETVWRGVDHMQTADVDCVVAVGSGSSINVARAMCLLDALDRPRDEVVTAARTSGSLPVPDQDATITPTVVVPTTMAGADLTDDGAISVPPDPSASTTGSATSATDSSDSSDRHAAFFSDSRLMPVAVFYDPGLFETTPENVLAASAMNGFDKGIETVYSGLTNPVSEAHALRGLQYFHAGLSTLRETGPDDDEAIDHAVIGLILVQYGRHTNLIHTFGNGIASRYGVQLGTVHGIVAPHVLAYIFDRVDGRRRRLARAFGVDLSGRTDDQIATAIVEEVRAIRDALELPTRLRSVDGLTREQLPHVADAIAANPKHERNPPGIDPSVSDVLELLETAW